MYGVVTNSFVFYDHFSSNLTLNAYLFNAGDYICLSLNYILGLRTVSLANQHTGLPFYHRCNYYKDN
jgi:hypothetical protein